MAAPEAYGDVLRIDVEFEPASAGKVGLVLRAGEANGVQERTVLAYSAVSGESLSGELTLDRTSSGDVGFHAGFPSVERAPVSLDGPAGCGSRSSWTAAPWRSLPRTGLVTLTDQVFPAESSTAVGLLAEGGGATLVSLSVTG